jgi:alpha 1,2-mannosyltransferase
MVHAAIFYLTQNTDVRRTHLKTSLYFLFRNFNATYKYPVVIFHEGDYDAPAQTDVLLSIRSSCRSLVTFQRLDKDDFELPSHIDAHKLQVSVELKVTPYWRNEKYRMMCRWWLLLHRKYATGYDYIMRLDDDSIIEEPIDKDLFAWMKEKDLVYASNMVHTDCGICNYGMKDFFMNLFPERKDDLEKLFIKQEVPSRLVTFHPLRSLLSSMVSPLPTIGESITLWMPIMYYNNFFITKTEFWRRPDVSKTLDAIDQNGSIFYFRWGDAPLQTLVASMHAQPNQIQRAIFKYSKRMQREAFKGDDGNYHSYMPDTYDKSSCMTER